METTSFYYRHLTIRPNFIYPPGYEPHDNFNGLISYWQPGAPGLRSFSQPSNLTAIFKSNSVLNKYQNTEYDPVHNYSWPKSDWEYANLLNEIL